MKDETHSYQHLILYDGVCILCNKSCKFVLENDPTGKFAFASLQSIFAKNLLQKQAIINTNQLNTVYCVTNIGTTSEQLLSKGQASIFVLNELSFSKAAKLLRAIPSPLLNLLYDLVAKNRYKIFGRYDSCPTPDPKWTKRFLS